MKAEKFEEFHRSNPQVYDTLVALARRRIANTGCTKMAIATLFEVARWEVSMTTTDPDYKISNDHKPFYARLMMEQEPDLKGIFNLKSSEADEWMEGLKERFRQIYGVTIHPAGDERFAESEKI
jgi:hypothetical protein